MFWSNIIGHSTSKTKRSKNIKDFVLNFLGNLMDKNENLPCNGQLYEAITQQSELQCSLTKNQHISIWVLRKREEREENLTFPKMEESISEILEKLIGERQRTERETERGRSSTSTCLYPKPSLQMPNIFSFMYRGIKTAKKERSKGKRQILSWVWI
jgi:hypothetical protein